MSIIEEAVRKTAEQHRGVPPAASSARPRARPAPAAPIDPAQVRHFQTVPADRALLEKYCVLPQVSDQAALRAYKILRTRVLRRLEASHWHSFAVTGVTAGVGKTLTAINLSIALAQDPSTSVFLLDLDLERPRIAHYLGMTGMRGEHGLSDYLLGNASIDSIIYSPEIERLAVIPNFEAISQSSELLTSPRMAQLLHALEAEVPRRILVVDMPPVLASDDVIAFAPQVDAMLLVIAEGITGRDAVRSAKEVLAEMNLLGVVLNRSAERDDNAYYHYGLR
mgnify:FL=1